MQQKSTDKFIGGQCHGFRSAMLFLSIIFPAKRHSFVIGGNEPAISNGHTMGVAGEIGEYCLRSSKGALGVNHPLLFAQRVDDGGKSLAVSQAGLMPEEL